MKRPTGFTLIELLVVIAIVGTLSAIAVPSYQLMRKNVALSSYTQEIVSALRLAQNRSISSQGGVTHGVHFDATQYSVYDGTWPAASPQVNTLQDGVQVVSGAPGNIEFKHLTGETADGVDHTFQIGFPGGRSSTITIKANGSISS